MAVHTCEIIGGPCGNWDYAYNCPNCSECDIYEDWISCPETV